MKYAMLIHEKPGYIGALAEDERNAVFGEYMALAQDPRARGGEQLQPIESATTVRVVDGETRTSDGPSTHAKEALAATSSLTRTTSMRRSSSRRGSRRPVSAARSG